MRERRESRVFFGVVFGTLTALLIAMLLTAGSAPPMNKPKNPRPQPRKAEEAEEVEVSVERVYVDRISGTPAVRLRSKTDDRSLVILIGLNEALAIQRELLDTKLPRPMTHDLLKSVIEMLGARVDRVAVTKLEEDTFYAEIIITQGSRKITLDARPSDSIALALRSHCPIFISTAVLDRAGFPTEPNEKKKRSPGLHDAI